MPRSLKPSALKPRKPIPHAFVLEALAALSPRTHPMFGCLAIYIGAPGPNAASKIGGRDSATTCANSSKDKIVAILREGRTPPADNGLWLATTEIHHESLRREFPALRSLQLFGDRISGWQVLPSDAPDFEESAMRACDLILARDPRIGKVPNTRKKKPLGAERSVKP